MQDPLITATWSISRGCCCTAHRQTARADRLNPRGRHRTAPRGGETSPAACRHLGPRQSARGPARQHWSALGALWKALRHSGSGRGRGAEGTALLPLLTFRHPGLCRFPLTSLVAPSLLPSHSRNLCHLKIYKTDSSAEEGLQLMRSHWDHSQDTYNSSTQLFTI